MATLAIGERRWKRLQQNPRRASAKLAFRHCDRNADADRSRGIFRRPPEGAAFDCSERKLPVTAFERRNAAGGALHVYRIQGSGAAARSSIKVSWKHRTVSTAPSSARPFRQRDHPARNGCQEE
jgi:hypothetical protein